MSAIVKNVLTGVASLGYKAFVKETLVKEHWYSVAPKVRHELRGSALTAMVCASTAYLSYRYYRRRMYENPLAGKKAVAYTITFDQHKLHAESKREGSSFMENGTQPKCQVKIAYKDGDNYVVYGAGIRMADSYLVTPAHNLAVPEKTELYLINERMNSEKKMETIIERLPGAEAHLRIAADLTAVKIESRIWSNLGTKIVRLSPMANERSTVTITSPCDNRYTMGTVKRSNLGLGRLIYSGSTVGGMSGAMYADGEYTGRGMHSYGGEHNGGYELLYIYNRLKIALMHEKYSKEQIEIDLAPHVVPESSEDFITAQVRGTEWEADEYGDGIALIRLKGGQYHITTSEILRKLKKLDVQNWADEMEYEELEEELGRREDYFPESALYAPHAHRFQGESRPPVVRATAGIGQLNARQASQSSTGAQAQQPTNHLEKAIKLEESLLKQQNVIAKSLNQLNQRIGTMSQQTPQPGPSGQVSLSSLKRQLRVAAAQKRLQNLK